MAPRALVSRIDSWVICASPKASCRSVADFSWEVAQAKSIRLSIRANVIVFRNPYRRLISAFLNKYVEHSKYRKTSLGHCPDAQLDCFETFVDKLFAHRFRCVDKVHFKPQVSRYRWRSFDLIFNADNLQPLATLVNSLWRTSVAMPFRTAANRSEGGRGIGAVEGQPAENYAPMGATLWRAPVPLLAAMLNEGNCPEYANFFNADLTAKCRRIYRADFCFLDAALKGGTIDASLHEQLTTIG